MTITPLIPDIAPVAPPPRPEPSQFEDVLSGLGSVLKSATAAEDRFAAGAGSLQSAIYERARADVALAVATAATERAAQALQSILSMQV